MVEYLGLADYLLIAEAVLGVPAEVLALSTDLHLADSALNAPAASFGGHELRPSFAQKAAVLCIRVCNNHPLVDGNKRVAYEVLREFVARNGYEWTDPDRKSTRLNSSHGSISYAVFCLKKKKQV